MLVAVLCSIPMHAWQTYKGMYNQIHNLFQRLQHLHYARCAKNGCLCRYDVLEVCNWSAAFKHIKYSIDFLMPMMCTAYQEWSYKMIVYLSIYAIDIAHVRGIWNAECESVGRLKIIKALYKLTTLSRCSNLHTNSTTFENFSLPWICTSRK